MARSDLDPKKLYEAYKRNPANQGLGSTFQEEGPGVGPSSALADELRRIRQLKGGSPRLGDFEVNAREREDKLRADQMEPSGLEKALREMRKYQETDLFKSPGADLSRLAKTPIMEKAAERISVSRPDSPMTMGVGANELSPLDQIAEQLSKIQPRKPEQKLGAEDEAAAQKIIAENAQKKAGSVIENKMSSDNLIEDSFSGAMADYINAVRGTGPDKKERTLDDYKKEFAEATGIDISGKVDKSQALMAMGLALMQNKAGKGFNVGKALSAIGAAGEAALPALSAAKQQAQSNIIAAGKYALETRAGDRAADEAVKQELMSRQGYYIYPKGKEGAAYENFDDGQTVPLNKYEMNKLIQDPDFSKNFDFIEGSQYMDVLKERAKQPDYGDKFTSPKDVSLIGQKEGVPEIFTVSAQLVDGNYKGKKPEYAHLQTSPEVVRRNIINEQKSIIKESEKFEKIAGLIQEGISIPEQVGSAIVTFGRNLGLDWGDGPTAIKRAKDALKRIQVTNAKDVLGEVGKTLSDTDRLIVAKVVGEIDLNEADPVAVLEKLQEVYKLVVVARQDNVNTAIDNLESQFGVKFRQEDFIDDSEVLSEEEMLAEINEIRKIQGLPPRK